MAGYNGKEPPLSRRQKVRWAILGTGFAVLTLFLIADTGFRLRDRASASQAYSQPGPSERDRARTKAAIRLRIAQLLRPDDGPGAISGNRIGRLIEMGHLYGRLALLEEEEGNTKARDYHMADAVRLLREAGVRSASEQHVRDVIAKQNRTRP
jgi:hypothetical protein